MSYFLFPDTIVLEKELELKGVEVGHMRLSRKIRVGELVELQDENNQRYLCKITFVKSNFIKFIAVETIETPDEPTLQTLLFIPLLKEAPFNFILQKSVELGVSELYFYESCFSKRFYQGDTLNKKIVRWERILIEAKKQCSRVLTPKLGHCMPLEEALQFAEKKTEHTIIYDKSGKTFDQFCVKEPQSIALFIGPEGGLSEEELDKARPSCYKMGRRILRAETAAICALSLIQYRYGDLNF